MAGRNNKNAFSNKNEKQFIYSEKQNRNFLANALISLFYMQDNALRIHDRPGSQF